jgi:hypothetical protein
MSKRPFHKKYFRSKNVFEKIIQAEIKRECRRRKSRLWGQECAIAPAFVDTGRGDRRQLVWVQPIDTRPDYYVLRIDSGEDVEGDDYNWDEKLLCAIEEVFDSYDRYNWDWDEKGNWVGKYPYDEDEPPIEYKWPMLQWSGGSWGVIKNYRKLKQ